MHPAWAEELRRRYLRGEANQFVLHGNVHDLVLYDGQLHDLVDYLGTVLLAPTKDVVIEYNLSSGVRFLKGRVEDEGLLERTPDKVLPALERLFLASNRIAVIVNYAEMIAPASDVGFSSDIDRSSVITLHRWSMSPAFTRSDNIMVLLTENLNELHPKLVGNPRSVSLRIELPDEAMRAAVTKDAKLADATAGLKLAQIKALLGAEGIDQSINKLKREIIERECFGMIEFVDSHHDFSVVGGIDEVKKELLAIAANMREGRKARCPMGLLFTGPMGTGKTFVAEAFVRETGLTAVKLKNFRSKWVGATEGNLERILSILQAMGQVIVIIDEGDRAFGSSDGDEGTSSRVIARIKEFMSDTRNRGRVMFILMTNRPDKLDIDIKRAGRLDKKIPFVYPQEASEVEAVVQAQLRRHKLAHALEFPRDRDSASAPLVGYGNAEIEAVVLLASERAGEGAVTADHMAQAFHDYLPSRDTTMLEFMELIAVFEASNRKMLPKKYAEMSNDALQQRLNELRLVVGSRR